MRKKKTKSFKLKFSKLSKRREKKRLRRKRKNPFYKYRKSEQGWDKELRFRQKIDLFLINRFSSPLLKFLNDTNFITGKHHAQLVKVDNSFCLNNNYIEAIDILKKFSNATFSNLTKPITVDFSKCKKVDLCALFVLQILRLEYGIILNKLNRKLKVLNTSPKFVVKKSEDMEVNKLLLMAGLLTKTDVRIDGLLPALQLGYKKGLRTRKHYSENSKGILVTQVVDFLNRCLLEYGYVINPDGKNGIEGLISEIFGNGEDHSPFQSYYLNAFFLKEMTFTNEDEIAGEVDLFIMNFGDSISKGLEETKHQNIVQHNEMMQIMNKVRSKLDPSLTQANLLTLYALQEGVSRLKHEDESRGTGTMKFINSFFLFGDFEDPRREYFPQLTIISGSTQVICDNIYKPFEKDGVFSISLNTDQSLGSPPNPTHLKNHSLPFPGTLLSVKIYLNRAHLSKKIDGHH